MRLPRPAIPKNLRWNRTSYFLLSTFLAVIALIIVVWWPLAEDYLANMYAFVNELALAME